MDPRDVAAAIHDTPTMAVIAVAGGGTRAIADLVCVPGASRTVLEALVPYSEPSLRDMLGSLSVEAPAASPEIAAAMARACYSRAVSLRPGPEVPVVGVACTAALATDRPKRGEHRAHVGICTADRAAEGAEGTEGSAVWSVVFEKGARDRAGEEDVVARLILAALAEACGAGVDVELGLYDGEVLRSSPA